MSYSLKQLQHQMRRANGSVIANKHKHKGRFCVEAMLFYVTQISDFNNNSNNNKTAYCSRLYHDTKSSVFRKHQRCRSNTYQEGVLCLAVVGNSKHRGGVASTDIHTERDVVTLQVCAHLTRTGWLSSRNHAGLVQSHGPQRSEFSSKTSFVSLIQFIQLFPYSETKVTINSLSRWKCQ